MLRRDLYCSCMTVVGATWYNCDRQPTVVCGTLTHLVFHCLNYCGIHFTITFYTLVNSCYVSQAMGDIMVSNSKSDL